MKITYNCDESNDATKVYECTAENEAERHFLQHILYAPCRNKQVRFVNGTTREETIAQVVIGPKS